MSAESVKFATNCDIREDKEQKRIKFYSADVKVALKLESPNRQTGKNDDQLTSRNVKELLQNQNKSA